MNQRKIKYNHYACEISLPEKLIFFENDSRDHPIVISASGEG